MHVQGHLPELSLSLLLFFCIQHSQKQKGNFFGSTRTAQGLCVSQFTVPRELRELQSLSCCISAGSNPQELCWIPRSCTGSIWAPRAESAFYFGCQLLTVGQQRGWLCVTSGLCPDFPFLVPFQSGVEQLKEDKKGSQTSQGILFVQTSALGCVRVFLSVKPKKETFLFV